MNTIRDPTTGRTWATSRELIQHIEATYHGYLRLTLPILEHLADSIANQHALPATYVERLQRLFTALADGIEMHLARQECRLFPEIRRLRQPVGDTAWVTQPAEDVQDLMERSVRESQDLLDDLQRVEECLRDPEWGGKLREVEQLSVDIRELEENLLEHFNLENRVLFQAVREMIGAQALAV